VTQPADAALASRLRHASRMTYGSDVAMVESEILVRFKKMMRQ
jgi:hypothetical protein